MTRQKVHQPEQLVLQIVAREPRAPGKAAASKKAEPKPRPKLKLTEDLVARSRHKPMRPGSDHTAVFKPSIPAPGVIPKAERMAMDSASLDAFNPAIAWAAGGLGGIAFSQGYTFLGYPYLSELAQVPEYRLISEVISSEAVRKWIAIKSRKDEKAREEDPEADPEKQERIDQLNDEFDRLKVRAAFEQVALQDGFFGRAHLFLDTGESEDQLSTPIGDGTAFTAKKFKKGFLKKLKTVEPVWTYPMNYNANDPLADDWYKPEVWYVMAKPVHATRLLPFISKPVPDLLKPAFSFGGLSMTQMAKPYVDNWLETRQSVNDIIQAFSVMVLKTDMQTLLQDSGDGLFQRADVFNNLRNNRGLMMVNKDTEDFANVSAPLGSLDKLQAQAQEHMSSVSRIPLVKLLGITPSGLNASSDGEIETFDDTIHAYQERFMGPNLLTIFRMAQINIWGAVDEDLYYEFVPLGELSEKEIADLQKTRAETHGVLVDKGIVDPAEAREAVKNDPHTLYPNIDPSIVPEPQIEPEHIKENDDEGGSSEGGAAKPKGGDE